MGYLLKIAFDSYYSYSRNHKDSYEDARTVFDKLSDKEKDWVASGNYKNTPYSKYRKVYYDSDSPYGFIDVHTHDKEEAIITTALDNEHRGLGHSETMLHDAVDKLRRTRLKRLLWMADFDNKASNTVAKKHNWELIDKNRKHGYNVYEVPMHKKVATAWL